MQKFWLFVFAITSAYSTECPFSDYIKDYDIPDRCQSFDDIVNNIYQQCAVLNSTLGCDTLLHIQNCNHQDIWKFLLIEEFKLNNECGTAKGKYRTNICCKYTYQELFGPLDTFIFNIYNIISILWLIFLICCFYACIHKIMVNLIKWIYRKCKPNDELLYSHETSEML